jgi:hypothetical protein
MPSESISQRLDGSKDEIINVKNTTNKTSENSRTTNTSIDEELKIKDTVQVKSLSERVGTKNDTTDTEDIKKRDKKTTGITNENKLDEKENPSNSTGNVKKSINKLMDLDIFNKDISNTLKKINNPFKTNDYIKEPEYSVIRTHKYFSPNNNDYIRCDIYLEPTVCYVKKLYIGESSESFYENQYSNNNSLDADVKEPIIWINEMNILINGLYLYHIPNQSFYEFNLLSEKITSEEILDYTINNDITQIAYLTNENIYIFDIYNNTLKMISKESHLTNYQNQHRIIWDQNNNIYFETYYDVLEENEYRTKNKIFRLNPSNKKVEILYDGTYTLGPSSFDNRYHIIFNFYASTTDGKHWLNKIVDTKSHIIIYEFLGKRHFWSNNSYELLFKYNNIKKHLLINDKGECVISEFNDIKNTNKYNY